MLPAGEAPVAGSGGAASEASRSEIEGIKQVAVASAGPRRWKGLAPPIMCHELHQGEEGRGRRHADENNQHCRQEVEESLSQPGNRDTAGAPGRLTAASVPSSPRNRSEIKLEIQAVEPQRQRCGSRLLHDQDKQRSGVSSSTTEREQQQVPSPWRY